MTCQVHATFSVVLLAQDSAEVGHHGASLILSTKAAGAFGTLQDWLTIDSTGLASFAGVDLSSVHLQCNVGVFTFGCVVGTLIDKWQIGSSLGKPWHAVRELHVGMVLRSVTLLWSNAMSHTILCRQPLILQQRLPDMQCMQYWAHCPPVGIMQRTLHLLNAITHIVWRGQSLIVEWRLPDMQCMQYCCRRHGCGWRHRIR